MVELIVVVIIMGAIAGFAIPNYVKSMETARAQDAEFQLQTIHAANEIYEARIGNIWPSDTNTYAVADINSNLGLNIIEDGMTYTCTGNPPGAYSCSAARDGGSFTLTVTEAALSGSNPSCSGSCP